MTVSNASKQIEVGERGVYHAINVIQNGIPEEISDCDSAKRAEGTPGLPNYRYYHRCLRAPILRREFSAGELGCDEDEDAQERWQRATVLLEGLSTGYPHRLPNLGRPGVRVWSGVIDRTQNVARTACTLHRA